MVSVREAHIFLGLFTTSVCTRKRQCKGRAQQTNRDAVSFHSPEVLKCLDGCMQQPSCMLLQMQRWVVDGIIVEAHNKARA